ncbi:patatin-related protein [Humibacillus xanthopallidus]|uniref:Patatin-related protein n=1 Tax=Humibacillus xanthopallidus TaxID=412689 RepID=A0A543PPT8_9MICO|nr:patatin-like protein [Humibacillus xanthopallidus]TQN46092.1 patatin-related protein [Humibacillus xanthopallidus]
MLREVRLALALNGGVSLAIWIGGVVDELLRAVSAGKDHPQAQPEWLDLCHELDVAVEIDVVVGTSAGGLNGAFLATGLANDAPNLVALQDLWIETGDFSQLLQPPRTAGIRSLLRGDTFFLPSLQRALESVAASGREEIVLDPPLDIRLTSTDLNGKVLRISDGESVLRTVDHSVEFRFTDEDFHFSKDPLASARVARACRSTASFPGAFEASAIPAGLFEARHAPALAVDGTVVPTYLVDGGVLNNLPARNAVEAIAGQPAGERVHRALALVVPDPGGATQESGDLVEPLLGRTMSRSSVGIPRNQSLAQFVSEVRDLNNDVHSRRAARAAFLGQLGALEPAAAWGRFSGVAEALFPSYRAARHRRSVDRMLSRLADRLPPRLADELVRIAGDADSVVLPWVPDVYDVRAGDAWGGSPVRRLAALLLTWTNLGALVLAEAGDDASAAKLLATKRSLSAIREDADTYGTIGSIDDLLLEEISYLPDEPYDAVVIALQRWADADDVDQLQGLVDRLSAHLGQLVDAVRPHVSGPQTEATRTCAGLVRLYDGAGPEGLGRLLLGFEVIEMAFGPADPPPDQTIRLAHFTADERVTIDPAGRDDPDEKLAGVQLAHFAAFLKRSWRANDWMWGRLDAAERLVRLLDEASGHELTRTGRLDHHLRAIEAAVLRDLLPVVAAEIGNDGTAGANVTPEAQAFADAVVAAGTPLDDASGRVSLAGVGQDELARLLGLNHVGVERLAGEVGMPRASALLLNAATTTATLLKDETPRGISLLSGAVSSLATLAWRWQHLPVRRRQIFVGLFWLVTLGALAVTVVQRQTGVPVWAAVVTALLILAGIVIAAGWVALFQLRRRSRRAARPVRVTPPPALDPPPVSERTPA